MTREILKLANKSDNNEDLTLLLTNVRSRENTLIFFLELFALSQTKRLSSEQYAIYKQEFLQKQKISTEQIKSIIQKTVSQNLPQNQLRSFWIKLKSILRVSFERAKTLGLLNDGLSNLYNEMLLFIDKFYEKNRSIAEYVLIERLIKKRTLETLIFTKDLYCNASLGEPEKIRSETFLKNKLNPVENFNYTPNIPVEISSIVQGNKSKENVSTHLRKREKAKIKLFNQMNRQSSLKSKNLRSLWQLQRKLIDLMQVKIECLIDKKKTLSENENALYHLLFSKNINNHKIITKYSHQCSKIRKVLQNRKTQSKRKFSQTRLSRKRSGNKVPQNVEIKTEEIKQKMDRPKTTQQSNSNALRTRVK